MLVYVPFFYESQHFYSEKSFHESQQLTNEYTLKDGCITFKDNNKDNTNVGNNVTICGSYTVIEDKNYKPKDDKYRHR